MEGEDPALQVATTTLRQLVQAEPRYALLVGVSRYRWRQPLACACRDAEALQRVLAETYGFPRENTRLLLDAPSPGVVTDGPPTRAAILAALSELGAIASVGPEGTFVLYFAGHGDGADDTRAEPVLLPLGADDDDDGPIPTAGLLSLVRREIPSKHRLLLLDTCHGGEWAARTQAGPGEQNLGQLWDTPTDVVMAAAGPGQTAKEDPQGSGHSLFAYALLDGLRVDVAGNPTADADRDGLLTDLELAAHVRLGIQEQLTRHPDASAQEVVHTVVGGSPSQAGVILLAPKR